MNKTLRGSFPWVIDLPENEHSEFENELIEIAGLCAQTGDFNPLAQSIHAWKSTAEAHAAGWGKTDYLWFEEEISVDRSA